MITILNVGLATYLTNQQGEREAFSSLTQQTLNRTAPSQNRPVIIGAFVFKKAFDNRFD
jgi:hypothetical protein